MRTIVDVLLLSLIAAVLLCYFVSALINHLPLMPIKVYALTWIAFTIFLGLIREFKPSSGDGFLF